MRKYIATFLVLLALVAMGGARADAQENALIIGNSQYQHTTRLKNPVNDATALAVKLEELGFDVLHGNDLNKAETEEYLQEFVERISEAEIAVFYYAGHGVQVGGRNFLVPVDFDVAAEGGVAPQLVSLDRALQKMASEKRVTLVFLDACRDDPFAGKIQASMAAGRSVPAADTDGAQDVVARGVQTVGPGLAKVEGGVGTLISFATQPGNVALDGAGNHSPFATGLLEFIAVPGTEVSDMLRNVRKHVYKETGGKQIPWDHSSLVERYYFKKKKQKRAPPP